MFDKRKKVTHQVIKISLLLAGILIGALLNEVAHHESWESKQVKLGHSYGIVSPLPDFYVYGADIEIPTPEATEPTPDHKAIIEAKIRTAFGSEAENALEIFRCESGLASKCNDGTNSNGSIDCGIAQINSVHGVPRRFLLDEDINIQIAKYIYDTSGWYPWVCARKLGIVQ